MNLTKLIDTSTYKSFKYLVAGTLFISIILALLTSWFIGYSKINDDIFQKTGKSVVLEEAISNTPQIRGAALGLGIISILPMLVLLSYRKDARVQFATFVICFIMMIVLLSLTIVGISETYWVKY